MLNSIRAALSRTLVVSQNARSTDVALLALRIMAASSLFYHHGIDKIPEWDRLMTRPHLDPLGIGIAPSLIFALFTDSVCQVLVLLGLATRIAAFFSLVTLGVVLFMIDHVLTTPFWPVPHGSHGELVWVYMTAYVPLLIAGAGRYSLDARLKWPAQVAR